MKEWRSEGVKEWRGEGVEEWRSGGVEEWRSGGVEEWCRWSSKPPNIFEGLLVLQVLQFTNCPVIF